MTSIWISLQQYKLLRATDSLESFDTPPMRFAHWFTLRRVRTTLIAGVLLVVMFFLSRSIDVRSRLNIAVPHHPGGNQTETGDEVKWSDFAYVQYVTNENYLCNSLMILEALHRRGTKADRIMMYPDNWQPSEDTVMDGKTVSELLAQARDRYQAKLVPIQVQSFTKGDPTWKDSYTKLLAFNQTQYKRVMSLDSDATVLDVSASSERLDVSLFADKKLPIAHGRAVSDPFVTSSDAPSLLARSTFLIQPTSPPRAIQLGMAAGARAYGP